MRFKDLKMTKEGFLIFMWDKYNKDGNLFKVYSELQEKGYSQSKIEELYNVARSRNWIKNSSNCDKVSCPFEFTEEGKKKAIEIEDKLNNNNIFLKIDTFLGEYKNLVTMILFPLLAFLLGVYGKSIWNYLVNLV